LHARFSEGVEEIAGIVAGGRHHTGWISALASQVSPNSNSCRRAVAKHRTVSRARAAELV